MGLMSARKMKMRRKKFRHSQASYREKISLISKKVDPLGGCSQAKGIVLEKFTAEAKQPNSALRKCVRVQLIKNNKKIAAFVPGNLASKFIDEHDEVIIESIGGRQGGSKGDIPCIRYQVIKVNDQPLSMLVSGKMEKGRR